MSFFSFLFLITIRHNVLFLSPPAYVCVWVVRECVGHVCMCVLLVRECVICMCMCVCVCVCCEFYCKGLCERVGGVYVHVCVASVIVKGSALPLRVVDERHCGTPLYYYFHCFDDTLLSYTDRGAGCSC